LGRIPTTVCHGIITEQPDRHHWVVECMNHAFVVDVVGDIPNGYTSDVVLNQQARVAHQGGMADSPTERPSCCKPTAVLDAGAYGGSEGRLMAGCLVVHA
jgi:hypothetical protein